MFHSGMTAESLRECLAGVPPVKLLGTELLKTHRPQGGIFPANVPRDQIKEAVTDNCLHNSVQSGSAAIEPSRAHPFDNHLCGVWPMNEILQTYTFLNPAMQSDSQICLAQCMIPIRPVGHRLLLQPDTARIFKNFWL